MTNLKRILASMSLIIANTVSLVWSAEIDRAHIVELLDQAAFIQDPASPQPVTRPVVHQPVDPATKELILSVASDVLADRVFGIDNEALDVPTSAPLALPPSDAGDELRSLLIRSRFLEIKINSEYQRSFPSLAEGEQKHLGRNISALTAGLRSSMIARLCTPALGFSREAIDKKIGGVEEVLLTHIGDPKRYDLTRSVSDQEVEALVKDFDRRLSLAISRIVKRLEKADGFTDVRAEVLEEVIAPALNIFSKKTTDPARQQFIANEFDKEYNKIQPRIRELLIAYEQRVHKAHSASTSK